MITYDVLIVGAGPAGLFTAIHAAGTFDKVLILEKQPDAGRKLLLTGSGQCNFTNIRPIQEFHRAYGDHGRFLKPALFHFTNQDIIAFFKQYILKKGYKDGHRGLIASAGVACGTMIKQIQKNERKGFSK